jgi:hypothetical protein
MTPGESRETQGFTLRSDTLKLSHAWGDGLKG